MFVEAAALTPLGHNCQIVLCHVAHEQQDVDMSCFPATRVKRKEEISKTKIKMNLRNEDDLQGIKQFATVKTAQLLES